MNGDYKYMINIPHWNLWIGLIITKEINKHCSFIAFITLHVHVNKEISYIITDYLCILSMNEY